MPTLKNFLRSGTVFIVLLVFLSVLPSAAQDAGGQFVGNPNYPAPDFPEGVQWINVAEPLTIEGLRGKVVVLDFWTYGCINCIHMIPVLKRLEGEFGDALAVIGVHSAKFSNEGQTESIRQIVQRYGLEHPVINDSSFTVWDAYAPYGVNAWPSFAVIDPRGNLLAVQAGEIPYEAFERVVGGMIGYFDGLGEINRDPLPIDLEAASQPNTALSFPGKVTVDPLGNRLFIADSSHNRIIITDLTTYEILDVIGTGEAGAADGSYTEAMFNKPQGMTLDGSILYIADTDNHVIRAVNLLERIVTTVAGTGIQGYNGGAGGAALSTDLSSPWDVEMGDDGILYIAMAGTHQIWSLSFLDHQVRPLIGSGLEGLEDGAFREAQLAQPSGLYYRDSLLYFADSESSSIRAADTTTGIVTTLAGPVTFEPIRFNSADYDIEDSILLEDIALPPGTYILQFASNGVGEISLMPTSGTCNIESTAEREGERRSRLISDNCVTNIELTETDADWTLRIDLLGSLLFQFGDNDGAVGFSRLQHALGVVGGDDGLLYVADTYNSKIKLLDPMTKEISTLGGLGSPGGFGDGDLSAAQFDEPGGLAYNDGKLYVADTNNQSIRVIDLNSQLVSTVQFPNPEALQMNGQITVVGGSRGVQITLPPQTVALGAGEIAFDITLPEGYKLNPNIPLSGEWSSSGEAVTIAEENRSQSLSAPEMPLIVPVTLAEGEATVTGELTIYYCEAIQESLCFIDEVVINAPVTVSAEGAGTSIHIGRDIIPPQVSTGDGL